MSYIWYGALFLLTLLTASGDSLLKMAGLNTKQTNYTHLLGGLVIYLLTGLVWFVIYKHIKFSVSGSVYGVMTVIVFTAIGLFYFHESLKIGEIVGIIMGIISIILLSRIGS